jgi:hypothetical protein
MELTEIIGCAFLALALLVATGQMAFAYGWDRGSKLERLRADKRVQGLLDSLNQSPPSRRLVYRKVDPRAVGKKRYLNSRLPGEVLA